MSKLGIMIIEWQTQGVLWAIENKPTAVEFMMTRPLDTRPMEEIRPGVKVSQVDLVRMLAEASPKTLLIIRAYPDDYGHSDFQDRMLAWSEPFRKVSNRVVAHSINEPTIFNADDAKRLNDYELGFIERMTKNGLIPMCFCLSESHLAGPTIEKDREGKETGRVLNWGNLPLWKHMIPGVEKLAAANGLLGFNEYDYPMWNRSRTWGYKWRLGHWELNLEWIGKFTSKIPRVAIGEGILDGGVSPYNLKYTGWRKVHDKASHLANIKAIESDSYHDHRVALYLLFARAPGHLHWDSFDASVMEDELAGYLKASPPEYWEPKEEKMKDLPENQVHALDVSEWGGRIRDAQWQEAYQAGFRLAIVQAWGGGPVPGGKNAYCADQLAGARKAGMITGIYVWIPPDDTTKTEFLIQAAKEAAGPEYQHIKFVAMDIEGEKPLHPSAPKARLADAISHVKDKPVVIYTSRYMWDRVMTMVTGFEKYPLWDARYDKLAELDTNWLSYGGWKERAMKQYEGSRIVAGGISADLNVAHLGRLFGTQPPPIPNVTQDLQALKGNLQTIKVAVDIAEKGIAKIEEKLIGGIS